MDHDDYTGTTLGLIVAAIGLPLVALWMIGRAIYTLIGWLIGG